MPTTTDHEPVTTTGMLSRVRAARAAAVSAEAKLLVLATEWADAHPDLTEQPEPYPAAGKLTDLDQLDATVSAGEFDERRGIPGYSWSCPAPFAAAIGRSTAAGDGLIRDALVLRHRLPRVWARVVASELEAWRARRIAQLVLGAPDDVCAHLDATVADVAHRVGPVTLERVLDEAMLQLYPEDREVAQLEALDARHATLHEASINDTGVAEMTLRGDWKDLHDFDQTLSAVAAALATADAAGGRPADSLDVRRSRAVGVLADPAAALALLEGRPAPRPRKRINLFVHLSADAVAGLNPVGACETTGRALLEQQIRSWCGRTDTHVSVTGVIDLNDHTRTDSYEIRDRLKTRTDLIAGSCVFPWCTRPARRCDHDHRVPHIAGGATCDCNVAPLCRRHHRLKTHAGWSYTLLESGVWLWSDPHGQQFLRDPTGTLDVTPPDRPVNRGSPADTSIPRSTGCRRDPPPPQRE